MVRIIVSKSIGAEIRSVWRIVSDLDSDPKYWRGMRSIRNLSQGDQVLTREVTLAFQNKVQRERVRLTPPSRIEIEFLEGPMEGKKILTLEEEGNSTRLTIVWEIKFRGWLSFVSPWISKHIRKGTEVALEKIRSAVEN